MALELRSQLSTFENSTNLMKYRSIQIRFRIAKRSIMSLGGHIKNLGGSPGSDLHSKYQLQLTSIAIST